MSLLRSPIQFAGDRHRRWSLAAGCRNSRCSSTFQSAVNASSAHLRQYAAPAVLVIDEIGCLSDSSRHADLLFEVVSRRYESKSTIVTTNKPFAEWASVFPNAACVVSLVDRLVHHAEVIPIEGESYRLKEAKERAQQRTGQRKKVKP